ncbi:unnamed protein product [Pedinophyceae sp. YPF-701]|nr:unnamed protein product [Pedinophyceae sp. YPF-701]
MSQHRRWSTPAAPRGASSALSPHFASATPLSAIHQLLPTPPLADGPAHADRGGSLVPAELFTPPHANDSGSAQAREGLTGATPNPRPFSGQRLVLATPEDTRTPPVSRDPVGAARAAPSNHPGGTTTSICAGVHPAQPRPSSHTHPRPQHFTFASERNTSQPATHPEAPSAPSTWRAQTETHASCDPGASAPQTRALAARSQPELAAHDAAHHDPPSQLSAHAPPAVRAAGPLALLAARRRVQDVHSAPGLAAQGEPAPPWTNVHARSLPASAASSQHETAAPAPRPRGIDVFRLDKSFVRGYYNWWGFTKFPGWSPNGRGQAPCPGVSGDSCRGTVRLQQIFDPAAALHAPAGARPPPAAHAAFQPTIELAGGGRAARLFFKCDKCKLRFVPPYPIPHAALSAEAVTDGAFVLRPAPGGEHCVLSRCPGGVAGVLARADVDVAALQRELDPARDGALDRWGPPEQAAMLPLSAYHRVRHALDVASRAASQRERDRSDGTGHARVVEVLPERGRIPETVLRSCAPGGLGYKTLGRDTPPGEREISARLGRIPESFRRALLPFQKEAVTWALEREGRIILADEMGVGKTVQGIALAACYSDEWPLLIVVPASLRLVWAEQIETWHPELRPGDIHVIESAGDQIRRDAPRPRVTIVSYEMLRNLSCRRCQGIEVGAGADSSRASAFASGVSGPCTNDGKHGACHAGLGWRVVVVDESHNLRTGAKGADNRRTVATLATLSRAKRRIMLTGTPSMSRPYDLYFQVHWMRRGLLGSMDFFTKRYCGQTVNRQGRLNVGGGDNLVELHRLLRREVMVRRLKADVLAELPPIRRQVVRLEKPKGYQWPPPARAQAPGADSSGSGDGEALTEEHATGLAKVPDVILWIREKLGANGGSDGDDDGDSDDDDGLGGRAEADNAHPRDPAGGDRDPARPQTPKMVIFAHHKRVMNEIWGALQQLGGGLADVGSVRIDGDTAQQDRVEACFRFQTKPEVRIVLVSVTAGGTGINLSAASVVVFAELPRDPGLVMQAESRAHRRGGDNSAVCVYFLCSRGTRDDATWQRLVRGLAAVSRVHDGERARDALAGSQEAEPAPAKEPQGACAEGTPEEGARGARSTQGTQTGVSVASLDAVPETPGVQVAGTPGAAQTPVSAVARGKRAGEDALPDAKRQAVDASAAHAASAPPSAMSSPPEPLPDSCSEGGESEGAAAAPEELQTFFEVSPHSGRLHVHWAADGSRPAGLSFPMTGVGAEAVREVQSGMQQLRETPEGSTALLLAYGVAATEAVACLTSTQADALADALGRFVAAYQELSAVAQNQLAGRVLPVDLDAALLELDEERSAKGATGLSTERVGTLVWTQERLDRLRASAPDRVPSDTHLVPMQVAGARSRGPPREFMVPAAGGARLCALSTCLKPVPGAPATGAFVESASLLVCGEGCFKVYLARCTTGGLRAQLGKLERGRCRLCGTNCRDLVSRLQGITRYSHPTDWKERRRQVVKRVAPRFLTMRSKKRLENLLEKAVEGNAWEADHIVPVYEGGGECTVDNMRTLCIPCHERNTAEQAARRAELRRAMKRSGGVKSKDVRGMLKAAAGAGRKGGKGAGSRAGAGRGRRGRGGKAAGRKADVVVVSSEEDSGAADDGPESSLEI